MATIPWPRLPRILLWLYAGLGALLFAVSLPQMIDPPPCGFMDFLCGAQYAFGYTGLTVAVVAGGAVWLLQREHRYGWHAAFGVHAIVLALSLWGFVTFLVHFDSGEPGFLLEVAIPFGLSLASAIMLWRTRRLRQFVPTR